jgi:hypothetical protein
MQHQRKPHPIQNQVYRNENNIGIGCNHHATHFISFHFFHFMMMLSSSISHPVAAQQQQAQAHHTLPASLPSSGTKRYCCGCTSRTSTIIAASFLLLGGCLYFAVGVFALHDTSESAPTEHERVMLKMLVPAMVLQTIVSALAIWGACAYRGWPVRCCLIWMTILMAFNFTGMIVSMSPVLLVGLVAQLSLFWMPMYGYGQDYTALKALAAEAAEALPVAGEDTDDDDHIITTSDGYYMDEQEQQNHFEDDDDDMEYDVELV